jgi:hypothetical protein
MKPFTIRRRTAGERRAYLQGHLAALRMALCMKGVPTKAKQILLAHIELETKQLEAEADE